MAIWVDERTINDLQKVNNIVGYGVRVQYFSGGISLTVENQPAASGGGSSSGPVPCQITSNTNAPEYGVSIYANGKYATSTGTGTLYVLDISYCEKVPTGTWVMGYPSALTVTG